MIIGAGQTPGEDLGNGRATAFRFAEEGARLFITARHQERADATAEMIREKNPSAEVYTYALDVTDEAQVKEMFKKASEVLGGIDVMVNNVGIMMHSDGSLSEADDDTWRRMTETNEHAAIYLYRNVYPFMKENGGAIVQISSIAAKLIGTNLGNLYNFTKAGMSRIGQMYAAGFAKDGIRVNTVVLGMVQTAMGIEFNVEKTGKTREEVIEMRNAAIPLKGGQGTAWDTANAALFLASDEAKFITGAELPVDGGATIGRG